MNEHYTLSKAAIPSVQRNMLDIILSLGKGVNSGRVGYRVHDLDMEILKDEKRHYIKQQKPSPGHPPSDGPS